jgi:hypothetical protein
MRSSSFVSSVTVRALAFSVCAASLAVAPSAKAQTFEGAVTMRVGVGGAQSAVQEVEYLLRGGRARINMQTRGRTVSMIAVPAEKKMFMLMDAQNMYIEMSTDPATNPAMKPTADAATKAIENAGAPKITRTGRKETIAGYECEHVLVASTSQSFDVCITKALGGFSTALSAIGGMNGAGRGSAAQQTWQKALGEVGAFPLKVTSTDGAIALEVTKVEKRSIPAAQFEVPSTYSKMALPQRPPGR